MNILYKVHTHLYYYCFKSSICFFYDLSLNFFWFSYYLFYYKFKLCSMLICILVMFSKKM